MFYKNIDKYFWSNERFSSGLEIQKLSHSLRFYFLDILFFLHFDFCFCLFTTYCLNILNITITPHTTLTSVTQATYAYTYTYTTYTLACIYTIYRSKHTVAGYFKSGHFVSAILGLVSYDCGQKRTQER